MSKFTAAELVEFYQEVADGAEMLLDGKPRLWAYAYDDGPNLLSDTERWRIKPAKKIIDMDHLVKSGIDCEFDDKKVPFATIVGPLLAIYTNGNTAHKYQACLHKWKHCRPRMNHKMFHDGGECPLPEGFEVVVYFRNAPNGEEVQSHSMDWSHKVNMRDGYSDIIGYEILGLADGWAYPWESDE